MILARDVYSLTTEFYTVENYSRTKNIHSRECLSKILPSNGLLQKISIPETALDRKLLSNWINSQMISTLERIIIKDFE